ncbi:conserved hypothetical protein [Candidatus Roizmanbacteria bacterium]|nr:conserved hypothetical protein [Candidatus Roizmanbacteria bacterium]
MYNRLIDQTLYLINNPTAIDKLIINIKFKMSKSLRESKVIIKNIGKVSVNVNFLFRNILSIKKKKELTNIFIINIMAKFVGGKIKEKVVIINKINSGNTNFFQNLPVASLIGFNYNR